IRRDLLDKCDLHTILRLPTGIFYAAGVKTNVLFFTRGKKETGNTKRVWFYDMRTNAPSYGKRTPFTREAFADFVKAYTGGISLDQVKDAYEGDINEEKRKAIQDPRWQIFTREQVAAKNDSLDIGLIEDESISKNADLGDPIDIAKAAAQELNAIKKELDQIMALLK
ncbi:MAG: N-6 DNA methylase, partial [Algoriphagus sp.]